MSTRPLGPAAPSSGGDVDSTWMVKPPLGPWKKLAKEEVRLQVLKIVYFSVHQDTAVQQYILCTALYIRTPSYYD